MTSQSSTPRNKQPHNIHAEQALLGRLLKFPDSYTQIIDQLLPEFFYDKRNGHIYDAVRSTFTAHKPIDMVTVYEHIQQQEHDVGGMAYLESLFENADHHQSLHEYVQIIKQKYFFRNTIDGASQLIEHAFQENQSSLDSAVDELEQRIRLLNTHQSRLQQLHISTYVHSLLQSLSSSEGDLFGISTGFQSLNSLICGFSKKNLIILAARPSVGKTALAINMALAALTSLKKVGFISMEMTGEEISLRMLSILTEIDAYRLKTASITSDEWNRVTQESARLVQFPLHVEERGSLSSYDIKSLARELQREKGLDILFVDYLQLMREKGKQENRNLEVSQISGALKSLAKELDIPVVALSQLSRSVEKRENKKPLLSDLRDSGSIEQDADIVLFLHREYLYDPEADPNHAQLIVAKQRNGAIGDIDLTFYPTLTLFSDR